MPVTRSQSKASKEAIIASILDKEKLSKTANQPYAIQQSQTYTTFRNPNSWYFENLTQKWYDIVKCLKYGCVETNEVALFRKNGVVYRIPFTFSFKYDNSNGMEANEPQILNAYKTDGNEITEEEKKYIIKMIKQQYNKITHCFHD